MNDKLLEILACPACKAAVKADKESVVCTGCGLMYPINEGIPIMLVEEGKKSINNGGQNA